MLKLHDLTGFYMKSSTLLCFLFLALTTTAQDSSYSREEIIYGRKDGMALTMIHIKPAENANGKAIIKVLSGNWVSSHNRIPRNIEGSAVLLKNGYSVFLVMHGSQPRYAIPDAVSDIKRAVRFIRFNAAKFKIDPSHIGITGSSSGGNLSLLVATDDENINTTSGDPVNRFSSRVQAVAVFFPPTDFFNWGQPGFSFINNEGILTITKVAGAFDFRVFNDTTTLYAPVRDLQARKQIYKNISPIYSVTYDDPPVLIIHGDKDRLVPLQQSESIISKFQEVNVPSSLIIKKGGGHGWDPDVKEANLFVEWFDKYLK